MTCGVYTIINTITGEEYVGKSVNIEMRWDAHRAQLKYGIHNKRFQDAWNSYGGTAFEFKIIEVVAELEYHKGGSPSNCTTEVRERLAAREAYHMNQRKPMYNGSWLDQEPRRRITLALPRSLADRIDALATNRRVSRSMIMEFMMPEVLEIVEQELSRLEDVWGIAS
jgi:GIY-YIG catalytic domain/Ribbon-helix-helix protein, copG family